MLQQQKGEQQYFTNSTGEKIIKIYKNVHHVLLGKVYPSVPIDYKQSHSLLHYARRLTTFLLSIQLKQLLSTVTFTTKKTFYSVYGNQSLAILCHSIDLHAALCKAQEYNIPLMQIVVITAQGERVVKEKLLINFAMAHLINQNFVLYGDWNQNKDLLECSGQVESQPQPFDHREGIYLRKGELIYAFIPLYQIAVSSEQVSQQNFIKVRNLFYSFEDKSLVKPKPKDTEMEFSPQPSSQFEPDISMFGAMAADNYHQNTDPILGDNFNDSDNQLELQA